MTPQQHEDNMTLFKFVTATVLIYLLICGMLNLTTRNNAKRPADTSKRVGGVIMVGAIEPTMDGPSEDGNYRRRKSTPSCHLA